MTIEPEPDNNMILARTGVKVVGVSAYNGVCDGCGGVILIPDTGVMHPVLVTEANELYDTALLLEEMFTCPHCKKSGVILRFWKRLEVSDEFKLIHKETDNGPRKR